MLKTATAIRPTMETTTLMNATVGGAGENASLIPLTNPVGYKLFSTSTAYYYNASGSGSVGSEMEHEVTRFDECDPTLPACYASRLLFKIFGPFLLLMSVVGGCLGVAVMTRRSLRGTASAVFIASLSVSDMLAVLTGLIRHFTLKVTEIDLRKLSPISCKIHRFMLYLSLDTSAWILIAICVERFLAVVFPHHHHMLKTPRRAAAVVAAIMAFQICFNMPVFFIWGKQGSVNDTVVRQCGYTSDEAKNYWTNIHHYLALLVYCLIPFVTMLCLNALIIRGLIRVNSKRAKHRRFNSSSMTTMLLCVTFYFIIITTPSFIFSLVQDHMFNSSVVTKEKHAKMELVDAVFTLLLYLNHSINFFLYCVTGRRFRRELKALLLQCLVKGRLLSPASVMPHTEVSRNTTNKVQPESSSTQDHQPADHQTQNYRSLNTEPPSTQHSAL